MCRLPVGAVLFCLLLFSSKGGNWPFYTALLIPKDTPVNRCLPGSKIKVEWNLDTSKHQNHELNFASPFLQLVEQTKQRRWEVAYGVACPPALKKYYLIDCMNELSRCTRHNGERSGVKHWSAVYPKTMVATTSVLSSIPLKKMEDNDWVPERLKVLRSDSERAEWREVRRLGMPGKWRVQRRAEYWRQWRIRPSWEGGTKNPAEVDVGFRMRAGRSQKGETTCLCWWVLLTGDIPAFWGTEYILL